VHEKRQTAKAALLCEIAEAATVTLSFFFFSLLFIYFYLIFTMA